MIPPVEIQAVLQFLAQETTWKDSMVPELI